MPKFQVDWVNYIGWVKFSIFVPAKYICFLELDRSRSCVCEVCCRLRVQISTIVLTINKQKWYNLRKKDKQIKTKIHALISSWKFTIIIDAAAIKAFLPMLSFICYPFICYVVVYVLDFWLSFLDFFFFHVVFCQNKPFWFSGNVSYQTNSHKLVTELFFGYISILRNIKRLLYWRYELVVL